MNDYKCYINVNKLTIATFDNKTLQDMAKAAFIERNKTSTIAKISDPKLLTGSDCIFVITVNPSPVKMTVGK